MKNVFSLFCVLIGITSVSAQNIDSLVYFDQDTIGLAKSIAIEEAAWSWTETLVDTDFSRVDDYVLQLKGRYRNIPKLAKDITQPFTTDEDKVRAIFRWITNNIAYDCAEYHNKNRSIGGGVRYTRKTTKQEKADKWEDVYYNYATKVLRNKKGICEGYATLFYELCRCSGIQCEVITGKVKKEKNNRIVFSSHAWNKLRIGDDTYFMDVTWASGFCDEKVSKFTKSLDNSYYLTSNDKQFPDHLANEKQTKRRNHLVGNY